MHYIGQKTKRKFIPTNCEKVLCPFYPNTYMVSVGSYPAFVHLSILITHTQISFSSSFVFSISASITTRVTEEKELGVKSEDFRSNLNNTEFDEKCPLDFKDD